MARQIGTKKITGTFDGISFYKREGQYYARMKSSLTKKKFLKDKVFEGSKKSAERFALGNRIASLIYRGLPQSETKYTVFCSLKRSAILLLKEGRDEEEVRKLLISEFYPHKSTAKQEKIACKSDFTLTRRPWPCKYEQVDENKTKRRSIRKFKWQLPLDDS